jgi:hypothetical protein
MSCDDKNNFDRLKRESPPQFVTRSFNKTEEGPDVYNLTINAAYLAEFNVAVNSTPSFSASEKNQAIFPTDIFGNAASIINNQLAQLVPYSRDNASLFIDVAIWALGLDERAGWKTWQKAIHGATPATSKEKHTGLKHFVSNRVRLSGQYYFFDQSPNVFIIPVMSVEEMREWNGTGYKAIVMPAKTEEVEASYACTAIWMIQEGPVAKPIEIEKARTLLEQVLLGMAYWLTHVSPKIVADLDESKTDEPEIEKVDGVREKLQDLCQEFTNMTRKGVTVPCAVSNQDPSQLKVRIVTFSDHSSEEGHPAPDPLLLTAKAACNWSALYKQPLKAAAEPQAEELESDELYHLAEEEYLEHRRNAWRPKTWEDLARGLGQPHGYQHGQEGESKTELPTPCDTEQDNVLP